MKDSTGCLLWFICSATAEAGAIYLTWGQGFLWMIGATVVAGFVGYGVFVALVHLLVKE